MRALPWAELPRTVDPLYFQELRKKNKKNFVHPLFKRQVRLMFMSVAEHGGMALRFLKDNSQHDRVTVPAAFLRQYIIFGRI